MLFQFPEADSLLKDHSYKAEAQNFLPTIMSNIIHNFLCITNDYNITISSFLESVDETIIAFSCDAIKTEYNTIYPGLFQMKKPTNLSTVFFHTIYENELLILYL